MAQKSKADQIILGYLFAIGATAIWSGNFIIARGLSDDISPVSLAFWRWAVAVVAFLPFALKQFISEWRLFKKHKLYLFVTALLGITVFNTLIYIAGHTTSAINLSLISITFPVFVIIFSRFLFKEVITLMKAFGILLVVIGVVLLITKGDLSKLLNISFAIGDSWMLLAAVTFAIYTILLKQKPAEISLIPFQFYTFVLGLFLLAPVFAFDTSAISIFDVDRQTIGAILYVGICASLIAFILWSKAVVNLGPARAGIIYYSLPVFSGLLAHIFLGENVTIVHLVSTVCIVAGILVANLSDGKQACSVELDSQ